MIRYEWKCKLCDWVQHVDVYQNQQHCDVCDALMVRVYGFAYRKPMQPHFNASTGKYVSNAVQFADQLKAQSEKQWLERGIETKLVPIDPRDVSKTGATEEGLEPTYRQARQGKEPKKLIL